MSKNEGKIFEEQFKTSCNRVDSLFYYRIKDVNAMSLKPGHRVSKNLYDSFLYKKPNLIPVELKSVDGNRTKSIGFQLSKDDGNKHIKYHQIEALKDAAKTKGTIPGLILNFRFDDEEETYFIHINEFVHYMMVGQKKLENTYSSKVNEKSINIDMCREIGIPIRSVKAKTKYYYHIKDFMGRLLEKYKEDIK